MLIAKVENGKIIDIADMRSMFPNTSFPDSGPNDEWFTENSCMKLNLSAPCNRETEILEPCEPYIVDGFVYTNKAVPKPVQEVIIEPVIDTSSNASIELNVGTASSI